MQFLAALAYWLVGEPWSTPRREGDAAYRCGMAEERNPYSTGSAAWAEWNRGYRGEKIGGK
jgi:hypothetical protein